MMKRRFGRLPAALLLAGLPLVVSTATAVWADGAPGSDPAASAPEAEGETAAGASSTAAPVRVACSSKIGERKHCAADTSQGVVLAKSSGEAPCLLGKTWGYDDKGIWVSDGCGGEFVVGQVLPEGAQKAETKLKSPHYVPNAGFLLYEGENGQIYMRLFSYVRYLNQKGLDPDYTDFFGNVHEVDRRQDIQLTKFFLPFSGWFLTPKMRYYLYVWSNNAAQGQPAQTVGAGNLSWTFNRFVTLGGGITSLPGVRSTEGQFPYWLGVDDRLIADEFFRPSYTTGVWVKGELPAKLKYMAMLANNLSTLGVSAAQLDNRLDTTSLMLQWLPTTGEFGLYGTFGDYDYHEKLATRLAAHYTHSTEDTQSQPGTDSIENTQIRLTDGSVIFTPNLFGAGITVNRVLYEMASADGGIKYKGFSAEAEYYRRRLGNFEGLNTGGIDDINDHGFQVQTSAMVIPKTLQVYLSGSQIRGRYGDASELRAGANWYVVRKRGLRFNAEWLHLDNCPVGYTAVPYAVGSNGDIYHLTFEMNF
jgi:DUF3011 family protein